MQNHDLAAEGSNGAKSVGPVARHARSDDDLIATDDDRAGAQCAA